MHNAPVELPPAQSFPLPGLWTYDSRSAATAGGIEENMDLDPCSSSSPSKLLFLPISTLVPFTLLALTLPIIDKFATNFKGNKGLNYVAAVAGGTTTLRLLRHPFCEKPTHFQITVQSSRLAIAAKDLMMMMMMTSQHQASIVVGFISFYAYECPYCNCCFHDSNFHCTKHKKKHKAQGTRQKQPQPTPSLANKI